MSPLESCPAGHAASADAAFCEVCGSPLRCPAGHPAAEPGGAYCEQCGLPLPGARPATRAALPEVWQAPPSAVRAMPVAGLAAGGLLLAAVLGLAAVGGGSEPPSRSGAAAGAEAAISPSATPAVSPAATQVVSPAAMASAPGQASSWATVALPTSSPTAPATASPTPPPTAAATAAPTAVPPPPTVAPAPTATTAPAPTATAPAGAFNATLSGTVWLKQASGDPVPCIGCGVWFYRPGKSLGAGYYSKQGGKYFAELLAPDWEIKVECPAPSTKETPATAITLHSGANFLDLTAGPCP